MRSSLGSSRKKAPKDPSRIPQKRQSDLLHSYENALHQDNNCMDGLQQPSEQPVGESGAIPPAPSMSCEPWQPSGSSSRLLPAPVQLPRPVKAAHFCDSSMVRLSCSNAEPEDSQTMELESLLHNLEREAETVGAQVGSVYEAFNQLEESANPTGSRWLFVHV
ncbi:MAG: hypothetical protein ACPIOQ_68905, partial [Promethearchaeia archaeon]